MRKLCNNSIKLNNRLYRINSEKVDLNLSLNQTLIIYSYNINNKKEKLTNIFFNKPIDTQSLIEFFKRQND